MADDRSPHISAKLTAPAEAFAPKTSRRVRVWRRRAAAPTSTVPVPTRLRRSTGTFLDPGMKDLMGFLEKNLKMIEIWRV